MNACDMDISNDAFSPNYLAYKYKSPEMKEAFFTQSGNGDGIYHVYAIYEGGEIVALEVRFDNEFTWR